MKMELIGQRTDTIRKLLLCGAIAGPLFVALFLLEGATRSGYNPLRHPVSSLALGEFGWIQVANFLLAGSLSIAFAIGLRLTLSSQRGSTSGPFLIAVWGIGLLGAGIFLTDPVSGYPAGSPDLVLTSTSHGILHDQFSLLGFAALAAACFVYCVRFTRQGQQGWAFYSAITGILFPIGIFLASAAFSQNPNLVAFGGLIQRLTITIGWAWLSLLSIHYLHTLPKKADGTKK